jgi:hypothetical protein
MVLSLTESAVLVFISLKDKNFTFTLKCYFDLFLLFLRAVAIKTKTVLTLNTTDTGTPRYEVRNEITTQLKRFKTFKLLVSIFKSPDRPA